MRYLLAIAALAFTSPAGAQADGPYKLIITWYQSGIVAIDYPSRARCERARLAVAERMRAKAVASGLPAESGDVAFCIPG